MLLPSTTVRHRDMFGVILVMSLKLQEIVIAAALFIRKLAANGRASAINGAASGAGVEETADPAKVDIFLAPHDTLVAVI